MSEIDTLKAMFPNTESEVCSAILGANNGDLNLAVNELLALSDSKAVSPLALNSDSGDVDAQSVPEEAKSVTVDSPDIKASVDKTSRKKQEAEDEEMARKLAQNMADEELARRIQDEENAGFDGNQTREQQEQRRTQNEPAEPAEWEQKLDAFGQKVEAGLGKAAKSLKGLWDKVTAPSSPPQLKTSGSGSGLASKSSKTGGSSAAAKKDDGMYSTLPDDDDDFSVISPTSPGLGQTDFKS